MTFLCGSVSLLCILFAATSCRVIIATAGQWSNGNVHLFRSRLCQLTPQKSVLGHLRRRIKAGVYVRSPA